MRRLSLRSQRETSTSLRSQIPLSWLETDKINEQLNLHAYPNSNDCRVVKQLISDERKGLIIEVALSRVQITIQMWQMPDVTRSLSNNFRGDRFSTSSCGFYLSLAVVRLDSKENVRVEHFNSSRRCVGKDSVGWCSCLLLSFECRQIFIEAVREFRLNANSLEVLSCDVIFE